MSPSALCGPCAAQMRQSLEDGQLIPWLSENAPLWGGLCLPLQSSVWSMREAVLFSDAATLQSWACHVVPSPQLHIQPVAPRWHVNPLGKKPVLMGGSLFTLLGFI